ncbi:MAG: discoidin domain-containing protein [Lentisphaerae bacterium]|nr:discoidin domain-containing protein [Lentisphaerota bacterium]
MISKPRIATVALLVSGFFICISGIAGKNEATGKDSAGSISEDVEARRIAHAAVNAEVITTSTHTGLPGEGPPSDIVDGDLTTRWSSEYSAPQEVVVNLPKVISVKRLKLFWERASAMKYLVYVSTDGKEWKNIHLAFMKMVNEPVSRIDDIDMKDVPAKMIKLSLLQCINPEWGFSLYEMAVISE